MVKTKELNKTDKMHLLYMSKQFMKTEPKGTILSKKIPVIIENLELTTK